MTHTEKLLCDLIALPSVNPAFLPARDPRAGEGRVAAFLAATAARAGLVARIPAGVPHSYENAGKDDLVLLSMNLPGLD